MGPRKAPRLLLFLCRGYNNLMVFGSDATVTQDTAEALPLVRMLLRWKEWDTETTLAPKSDPGWKECRGKYDFTTKHVCRKGDGHHCSIRKLRLGAAIHFSSAQEQSEQTYRRHETNDQRNVAQFCTRKREAEPRPEIMWLDWKKNFFLIFFFFTVQVT